MPIDCKTLDGLKALRAAGVKSAVMEAGGEYVSEVEFYEMDASEKTEAAVAMSKGENAWIQHLTGKDKDEVNEAVREELLYSGSQ